MEPTILKLVWCMCRDAQAKPNQTPQTLWTRDNICHDVNLGYLGVYLVCDSLCIRISFLQLTSLSNTMLLPALEANGVVDDVSAAQVLHLGHPVLVGVCEWVGSNLT